MARFELEDRCFEYSKKVIDISNTATRNPVNNVIINQLIRSATSIGANYSEANESDTTKEFRYRLRIARKEAKESTYWLRLLMYNLKDKESEIVPLVYESEELVRILASIYHNVK